MKISFHGAARTVTGSKHLLTLKSGKKVLLDCGMFQGLGKETDLLNRDFGFEPAEVDVMILSHAHIDHSGLIPKLIKDGFKGKIFCTPATRELTNTLLEDSAEIQEDEVKYINKRRAMEGLPYLRPLYNAEDAKISMNHFVEAHYGEWFDVIEGVKAMFTDAGHIIGSACVHVKVNENGKDTFITFSGDVGKGDTWKESYQTEAGRFDNEYTLSEITDSTIIIDMAGTSVTTSKMEIMTGMEITTTLNNKISGKIILDKASGIIRQRSTTTESNGTTEGMGGATPITSKKHHNHYCIREVSDSRRLSNSVFLNLSRVDDLARNSNSLADNFYLVLQQIIQFLAFPDQVGFSFHYQNFGRLEPGIVIGRHFKTICASIVEH